MKPVIVLGWLGLGWAVLSSSLSASGGVGSSWEAYAPASFKVPEAVLLPRNPFQGHGRALPAVVSTGVRNSLSSRLAEQVRKGVHGLVISADHPCLLFGNRIVSIGQSLELPVEDQGGRRSFTLRLRSVARDQLAFLVDEAGARLLGAEEWTCVLKGEIAP